MRFNLEKLGHIEFKKAHNPKILEKMKEIYPQASEEQLLEGLETLTEYLKVAIGIVNRLTREEAAALTNGQQSSYDTSTKVESNQLTTYNNL